MTRALMTGITGMRSHQQKLDVVANNLANMNTIGFKAQVSHFSDLMYNIDRRGSGPTDFSGGVNPVTVGSGSQLAQVTRRFSQGTLQGTGEILDFAIQGGGFFTLASPQSGESVYTRAGSFAVDANGRLFDPSTGYLVQRWGNVGEGTEGGLAFQKPGDNSIRIPMGVSIPGEATQSIDFIGNLPSSASQPTAEVLASFSRFSTASGPATLATSLSDLTINQTDYAAGDQIEISGTNPDGSPFSASLAAEFATMGDLLNELNNQLSGATAELRADGTLAITADQAGESFLSLTLRDANTNVGATSFSTNSMIVETEGSNGDSVELSMEVFDARGESHRLNLDFRKTSINTWEVTGRMNPASGVLIDDSVFELTFNEDGTFALAGTDGVGDADIEVQFASMAAPMTIALNFDQLKHVAADFSLTQSQDGFPPGTLASLAVTSEGQLTGLATNGKTIPLAQLALASFPNDKALNPIGNNYYERSLNSGNASIGTGLAGGRGQVMGGQLESSNVDIAQEFTQLIVAQRGFSANARTITVANQMLEELTSLIR
jgi:flagellar hook protein FlgE